MSDRYQKAYFDLVASTRGDELSASEGQRIRETVRLVPESWKSIIDVGGGDGRVSRELVSRGISVSGIDWSTKSLERFPGPTYACDIRNAWPAIGEFDGAICCEVLEHLHFEDARRVISQIRDAPIRGFLITVPANENLNSNTVDCAQCGGAFHIWGHCQTFRSFDDVDRMVGMTSTARVLINPKGARRLDRFAGWQRSLGAYPYAPSYLCSHCGASLKKPVFGLAAKFCLKGVAALNRLFAPFQPKAGWFACRYDMRA